MSQWQQNDQRKPGYIEPGARKVTNRLTKSQPRSEPNPQVHNDSLIDRAVEKNSGFKSPTKSSSFEAPQQAGAGKGPCIKERTMSQSWPGLFQHAEAQTVKEMIHSQTQTDAQLGVTDIVTNTQQQIKSIRSECDGEIANLQAELQREKDKAAEYQQNFLDVQEQVFSLQHRRLDITEDTATSEYRALCIAVEDWIDSRFNAVLDLDAKIFGHNAAIDQASGSRLLQCIMLMPGATNSRNIIGTLQYYIRSAIMNYFCHDVFERELYETIGKEWMLIRTIEKGMNLLEPRRG